MSFDPDTSGVDHHISLIDKTNDTVLLIFVAAYLIFATNPMNDVIHQTFDFHETFTGAKTFHVDHATHGHNNEDQQNDALGKMNKLINSMRREFHTIRKRV